MEDGDQTPLTYEEFAISEAKPSFPTNPREFTITPQKGVMQAHSSLKLRVKCNIFEHEIYNDLKVKD